MTESPNPFTGPSADVYNDVEMSFCAYTALVRNSFPGLTDAHLAIAAAGLTVAHCLEYVIQRGLSVNPHNSPEEPVYTDQA